MSDCRSALGDGLRLGLAAVLMTLAGCGSSGPELATVDGVVTLDGQPLEGARVTFTPQEGRSSMGITDATGKYSLQYTTDRRGALLGTHTVQITTAREAEGGEGGQPKVEARKEILPKHYHVQTDLKGDVKKGTNTLNFELSSKKKVVP